MYPAIRVGLVAMTLLVLLAPQRVNGQAPSSEARRLSLVPVPTAAGGRVENLYTGSYALLVGVAKYDSPAWPSLPTVPSELGDLKAALDELGFDAVESINNPTGDDLRRAVADFIGRYGYKSGARLLFYFSGHGQTLDDGRRGYFVPRDAPDPQQDEPRFRRVAISMDLIATWARDITARHALFAFDSCFSGTIFRTRERMVPPPISTATAKKAREFLSAGDANEPVPSRSVFTPMFTRALRGGADINQDGFVTGTELGNWIQAQVIRYQTRQTPQFGKLRDPDFDEGDIVFAVPATPAAVGRGGPPGAIGGLATSVPARDEDLARREELALWEAIRDSTAVAPFEDYLRQYPSGRFRVAAEDHMARLRAAATPSAAPSAAAASTFKVKGSDVAKATRAELEGDCNLGNGAACAELGWRYDQGIRGVAVDDRRAANLYEVACADGNLMGCNNLGAMFKAGEGVSIDVARAKALYERACNGGYVLGCDNLGTLYDAGNGVSRDYVRAAALYQRACDGGELRGCHHWGWLLAHGLGVPVDVKKAAALYQRACDGNVYSSCTRLGSLYRTGAGVTRDYANAMTLYKRACDNATASGCIGVAMMYNFGYGVRQDYSRAFGLYSQVCDKGESDGCWRKGLLLADGNGTAKDEAQAVALFQRACEGGGTAACNSWAIFLENGRGVAKDLGRALSLYVRACDGGDENACTNVGLLYEFGRGTPKDDARAVSFYRRACDMGQANGCSRLGNAYENGHGVAGDRAKALEVYRKACAADLKEACDAVKRLGGESPARPAEFKLEGPDLMRTQR